MHDCQPIARLPLSYLSKLSAHICGALNICVRPYLTHCHALGTRTQHSKQSRCIPWTSTICLSPFTFTPHFMTSIASPDNQSPRSIDSKHGLPRLFPKRHSCRREKLSSRLRIPCPPCTPLLPIHLCSHSRRSLRRGPTCRSPSARVHGWQMGVCRGMRWVECSQCLRVLDASEVACCLGCVSVVC